MRFVPIFWVTIASIGIFLFQLPKLNKYKIREKAAFLTLLILGWLLFTLIILYPRLPGPTDLIDFIYKPIGKILE